MRRTILGSGLLSLLALLCLNTTTSAQDVGVTATEVKIGNAEPYSGSASAYGACGTGLSAYFKKINDQGGINGRKINFITYDSAYSPPRMVEVTRRLVEQDHVLAMVGSIGTPTNTAIWKYMNTQQVPQLFVLTGATKWGDPKGHPWTMGWLPTYQSEGRVYAQYVLDNVPNAKIGILYQNDDYGKDYVVGFKDVLAAAGRSNLIVKEQTYETTDPTIDSQIVNLKNSGANVFLDITIPKYASQAIKKAYEIGWHPLHFLNSVSNSANVVLKPAGIEASKGLITIEYVIDPADPRYANDPGFKEYAATIQKYEPRGNPYDQLVVWGYSVAQTFAQVLKQCGNDVTRKNLMRQAANLHDLHLPLLLPGITINTSPTDFYPIKQVYLAKFDGTRWVLFGHLYDTSKMHR
jgi:branched-chain amino acid transport system substrate-binding protein